MELLSLKTGEREGRVEGLCVEASCQEKSGHCEGLETSEENVSLEYAKAQLLLEEDT